MRVSIPGHVFLNFSGTAQNWMAIVVPPHCPLPRGSSFLELDYWEETDHSEDLSNFIGASPKLDAKWRRSRLSRWCNFITQLAMNQMFPRRRIDVGTKSISFVLISKPSHNFVSSSPVILFVQLLTLIKKWCGLKTRMDVVALHFYLLRILDLTEVKLCNTLKPFR